MQPIYHNIDTDQFKPNDNLNPYIWKGDRMDIFARKQLLNIAKSFISSFDVADFDIEDVVVTGSIANYNWDEKNSDLDLHIIVDFSEVDENEELVKAFFDELRSNWNSKHSNIRVYGYPVEVYVQDSNEEHLSSGIYSIIKDDWVVKPSEENMETDIDDDVIREKASMFMGKIDNLEERLELSIEGIGEESVEDILEDANKLFDEIKGTRREAVGSKSFELSTGNLVFKVLRRNGYIGKLNDIRTCSFDYANSVWNGSTRQSWRNYSGADRNGSVVFSASRTAI